MSLTPIIGAFSDGDTLLHRLDPRVKLTGLVALVAMGLWAQSWTALAIASLPLFISLSAIRPILPVIVRDAAALWLFYLLTIIIHVFVTGRDLSLAEAVSRGLFFAIKIAIMSVSASLVSRTTHPSDWSLAAYAFGRRTQKGLRATGPFALRLGLAMKTLPMLLSEANRIRQAQFGRGLRTGGSPVQRIRSLLPLWGPLLEAGLDRADTISDAMQSRGFVVRAARSFYRPLKLAGRDVLTVVLMGLTIILFITFISSR
ncbi:MAG: energy-coupling factor transporter transmembrane protein EcfT [Calditrichaeota bacterium]|nr:energy-coupling factor transporter transmembrane protein EcfT [Calditrichota bacterium]